MGEFLEIAKVMVQPTMKLLDMCSAAIGMVYEPRHVRKLADAEAYKIKQLSTAIMESDNLPVSYENGYISMSTVNFEDFIKRAEFREKHQLLREQNNIERVVGKAYQELTAVPEVTSDPVDEDWTTRFFNTVKDISSDDMQRIWGQILAGEIVKPGSYSLKTLDVIRNLNAHYASIFQKISPFVIKMGDMHFIPSESSIMEKYQIKYGDILVLDDIGLTISNPYMSNSIEVLPRDKNRCVYTFERLMQVDNESDKTISIPFNFYLLSNAGVELYNTLCVSPDNNMFDDRVDYIFQKYNQSGITISVLEAIDTENKPFMYSSTPLRQLKK